jgi:hypothetical protein
MNLRFEFTLGWLSIVFDPQPEVEESEQPMQGIGSADSVIERRDDHFPPGLHTGFRGGYYEE